MDLAPMKVAELLLQAVHVPVHQDLPVHVVHKVCQVLGAIMEEMVWLVAVAIPVLEGPRERKVLQVIMAMMEDLESLVQLAALVLQELLEVLVPLERQECKEQLGWREEWELQVCEETLEMMAGQGSMAHQAEQELKEHQASVDRMETQAKQEFQAHQAILAYQALKEILAHQEEMVLMVGMGRRDPKGIVGQQGAMEQ